MTIIKKSVHFIEKRTIDLDGPDGNAFCLLGYAQTLDSNYDFPNGEVWQKLEGLKSAGAKLDSNYLDNIAGLQVLSTGERSGRILAEIGYPDGTVVLFYSSMKGTGSKTQGEWYPIPGFAAESFMQMIKGWFIKDRGIDNRYGVKTFQGTADYLSAN